jgi:hypothetical protein
LSNSYECLRALDAYLISPQLLVTLHPKHVTTLFLLLFILCGLLNPFLLLFLLLPACPPSSQIDRVRRPQPRRPLRMVSILITRVWMHQCRKWPPMDNQPRDESSKLRYTDENAESVCRDEIQATSPRMRRAILTRRKYIHLEHPHRMRANRSIPHPINPQLWNYIFIPSATLFSFYIKNRKIVKLTFPPNPLPQLRRILDLPLIHLLEIHMNIKAGPLTIRNGRRKRRVRRT